jgi:hypothetical protein
MRHKFQLAVLVPTWACIARGDRRYRRQRIGPEPVRPFRSPQAVHLSEAPDKKNESDEPNERLPPETGKPIAEFAVETGRNDEGNHPPAAFVAVVKPLD